MTELEDLRSRLSELTRQRNQIVADARLAIELANQEYDREAIPLARRIKRLEPTPEPEPTPTPARSTRRRSVSLAGTEDWTDDERRHYLELSRR